ncbi:MAG: helix-turn-helix domain-containing protein [Chloroflexota bacterium]|nr:helix-turn-helix domain-containing protein [Chloroflexota bacterium]
MTISKRAAELVEEVLAQQPLPTETFVVPGIDLAHEVYRLVQLKHESGIAVRDALPPLVVQEDDEPQQLPASGAEEIIDQTLLVLHRRAAHFGHLLGERPSIVSLKDLRRSRLGCDLIFLSRVAKGEEHSQSEKVFQTVSALLDLLFGTLNEDLYQVPWSFWEEPLGEMLSQAKLRAVDASELMSIGNAAQKLGVTRPTVYRWMDDRVLNYVRDEMSGRTFVLRGEVEQLQESNTFQANDVWSDDRSELAQID